jgi:hypothetical protein
VTYTVNPRSTLATGTQINAQATVVFDTNAPIATAPRHNKIDAGFPSSAVAPLPPTTTSTTIPVSWAGSDAAGPGVASYSVYYSDNGGTPQPYLLGTTQTSTTFTGQVGHTYTFYSVATDNLGFVQATPNTAQATIAVIATPPVTVSSVHWATIQVKTGTGKKARTKSETALDVQFSGPVFGAGNLAAYQLSKVTTHKVKKTVKMTLTPIKLSSALPALSPTTTSVALVPRAKPNLAWTYQLQINAADITDALGRPLDGNHDGQPGGDFVGRFGRNGLSLIVASGQWPVASEEGKRRLRAVDLVLESRVFSAARHASLSAGRLTSERERGSKRPSSWLQGNSAQAMAVRIDWRTPFGPLSTSTGATQVPLISDAGSPAPAARVRFESAGPPDTARRGACSVARRKRTRNE